MAPHVKRRDLFQCRIAHCLCENCDGTSIIGHYRQVAAVSRSFCTGLVLLDQD